MPAPSGASGFGGVLETSAVEVARGQAEQSPGDGDQRLPEVGVVAARDHEPVRGQADDHGTRDRTQESADDPAPKTVRDEHREVPQRYAHHHPDENAQRDLPCFLRDGGRFFLGASPLPSPPSTGLAWVVPSSAARAALRAARRASGVLGRPATGRGAGATGSGSGSPSSGASSTATAESATAGSASAGAARLRPTRRRAACAAAPSSPSEASAYAGT